MKAAKWHLWLRFVTPCRSLEWGLSGISKQFLEAEFSEVRTAPVQHLKRPGLSSAAFGYYYDFPDFFIIVIGRGLSYDGSWTNRTGGMPLALV